MSRINPLRALAALRRHPTRPNPDKPSRLKVALAPRYRAGRNSPCPCGRRKPDGTPVKFKHCCINRLASETFLRVALSPPE